MAPNPTLADLEKRQLPPTLLIDQARKLIPLGRSTAYENAAKGFLIPGVPVIKVSERCFRVPTAALLRALGLTDTPTTGGAA